MPRLGRAAHARRFGSRRSDRIQVLADMPLGQKERCVLVRVGDTDILIGVAPGRVNTLHVFPAGANTRQAAGRAPAATTRLPRLQGAADAEPGQMRSASDSALPALLMLPAPLLLRRSRLRPTRASRRSPCTTAPGGGQTYSLTLQVLILMTALTLLPAILLMMTAFTRIVIVLAILRQALGAGQTPPNQVLVGLSLFLTLFVMAPVIDKINTEAVQPYMAGTIDATAALERAIVPLKSFMLEQTRETRHRDVRAHLRRQGLRNARGRAAAACWCRRSSRASSRPRSRSAS